MNEQTMTAVYLDEPTQMSVREVPRPHPKADEVLVKIDAVGVCGSDVHYYVEGRIGDFVVEEPLILGHESAGTIVECGEGVKNLKEGQRVALEPGIPCRHCKYCLSGRYNLCPDVQFMATPPVDGAFCEYVTSPEDFAFPLPEGVSCEEGSTVEPMAVACHSSRLCGLKPGEKVAVSGAGPVGLFHVAVASAIGAEEILVSDPVELRRNTALQMGAIEAIDPRQESALDEYKEWADVVFECSGAASAIEQSILLGDRGSRVVWVGMGDDRVEIPITAGQVKEQKFYTVFRYANCYPMAISLIAQGKVDPRPLITDRFEFPNVQEALKFSHENPDKAIKTMVNFPS
ncbi:MAG: NAD(P)-dependent alcohol dehydrogenase [Candidatus Brocadiia bacterium]